MLGTVLGVWAHPDDETYLSSGLMARAVREGSRVVCVTATRGEGGSLDEERWPSDTLGEIREGELMRCLAILGVTEHVFLDLPDVDWDTPLPEIGAAMVEDLVREIRPDTVITFGPEGMTGHVGHQSVHRWTTDAFHAHAKPGARLYYPVYDTDWATVYVPKFDELGIMRDGAEVPIHPRADIELVVELDGKDLDTKIAAINEHASQVEGLIAAFGPDIFREGMRNEFFKLGAEQPAPSGGASS